MTRTRCSKYLLIIANHDFLAYRVDRK